VTIEIDEDLDEPIYVYYELRGFYQNHRLYTASVDYSQLEGEDPSEDDIEETCSGYTTIEDMELNIDRLEALKLEKGLDEDDKANPCGLIAKSFFNDTFTLSYPDGELVEIEHDDIAWDVDEEKRFDSSDDQWIDIEDEHFMVWMRPSGVPQIRKLWGRIEKDLDEGDYTLKVFSHYFHEDIDIEKYFVLSTTNAFGGKNYGFAVLYILAGSICWCLAISLLVIYFVKRKQEGEEQRVLHLF
jgi:hypothetical protein